MPRIAQLDARLLVFDKDGVLLDFHRRWEAVTRARAAALADDELDSGEFEELLGLDPVEGIRPDGLLACGSREESTLAAATRWHMTGLGWPEARARAKAAFLEADRAVDFTSSSKPLPGVVEAIARLASHGWRLAVATTDSTADARRFLEQLGLLHHFASVVGADRVLANKPDPAMFLLACEEAGVPPHQALMVGDLVVDLEMAEAAKAGGAIGVLGGLGDASLLAPLATLLLADVAELAARSSPD